MATQTKYDSFRAAYDEEGRRYSELQSSARLLLVVCSFFLGGIGLRASDLPEGSGLAFGLTLLAAIAFGMAFFACVRALEMLDYKPVCDPEQILEGLPDDGDEPSDEDFLDDRIGDIVRAMPQNVASNDTRAARLHVASQLILLGIALALLGVAAEAWSDRRNNAEGDHGSTAEIDSKILEGQEERLEG